MQHREGGLRAREKGGDFLVSALTQSGREIVLAEVSRARRRDRGQSHRVACLKVAKRAPRTSAHLTKELLQRRAVTRLLTGLTVATMWPRVQILTRYVVGLKLIQC